MRDDLVTNTQKKILKKTKKKPGGLPGQIIHSFQCRHDLMSENIMTG
jgi:hypothetical protein